MAKVNLPQIQVPKKLRVDPEVGKFFDAITFNIFQLYTRTGGGSDGLEGLQEQIDANNQAILVNKTDIESNAIAIAKNIVDISLNALAISANAIAIAANSIAIAINSSDILALQQTFSWKTIPDSEEVTIADNQQMIVADGITVDGSLIIDGELSLI